MDGKWKVFFGIPAILALFVVAGCSFLPGDLEEGYIALNVGVPGIGRAIEMEQYDIDSLDLEVYGPDGSLLDSFEWLPPDSETYMIPGVGAGTYRLVATHNGVNGDGSLSVTEELEFEIAVMTITAVRVIPGLIGVLEVEGSNEPDINGYWTGTWVVDFDPDPMTMSNLYLSIEEIDGVVRMAHGFHGTRDGNDLIYEGDLEDMGYFVGSGTISEDLIEGPFTVYEDDSLTVVVFTGIAGYVPTDPDFFGDLSISGEVDGHTLNLSADHALAYLSEEDTWEHLDIQYFDADMDVFLFLSVDGSFDVDGSLDADGSYSLPDEVEIDLRYLDAGVGFDETTISTSGTMVVTNRDSEGIAGTITTASPQSLSISFDVPFAPATEM